MSKSAPRSADQRLDQRARLEKMRDTNKKALGDISGGRFVLRCWLARKDSNLQSPDPESGALPLGHSPAAQGEILAGMAGRRPGFEAPAVRSRVTARSLNIRSTIGIERGMVVQRRRMVRRKQSGTRPLPLIGTRRERLAEAAREGVFLCTHSQTRRSPASTAASSSSSRPASSSSTQIASSASHVAAHRAARPRRLHVAIAVAAATRAAAIQATRADRAKCSARPAQAAAARPRSPSARAARSRSTAATASPTSEPRATARTKPLHGLARRSPIISGSFSIPEIAGVNFGLNRRPLRAQSLVPVRPGARACVRPWQSSR
jgi:hypothetical protein